LFASSKVFSVRTRVPPPGRLAFFRAILFLWRCGAI
jgi:hypothetical protein